MSAMPERDVRQTPRVRLTYDDLVRMPDDGLRHELIDGEHYVTPTPEYRHQSIVTKLVTHLGWFLQEHPTGELMVAPFAIVTPDHENSVEPDVLYFSNERAHILTPKHLRGAPDLVVEVESPSTRQRDRTVKLKFYSTIDVREYWRIDPDERTVAVYRRDELANALPATPVIVRPPENLTTPLLPGLSLRLDIIFASRHTT